MEWWGLWGGGSTRFIYRSGCSLALGFGAQEERKPRATGNLGVYV